MRRVIQVLFTLLIFVLGYLIVESIMEPIRFNRLVAEREQASINRLKDIREAQKAYKDVYKRYTGSFDTLIAFLHTDSFSVVKAIGEIGATGVDHQSSYLMKYESGCLASLNAATNAWTVSRAEVIGTNGRITIPENFLNAKEVWLEVRDQAPIKKKFPVEDKFGFKFEIEAASDCIRNGLLENDIMPLADSRQIMETIDAIKRQLGLVYANDRRWSAK